MQQEIRCSRGSFRLLELGVRFWSFPPSGEKKELASKYFKFQLNQNSMGHNSIGGYKLTISLCRYTTNSSVHAECTTTESCIAIKMPFFSRADSC